MADKIDAILKDVAKQFGEGTVRLLSDTEDLDVPRISSGSLNLDLALGGGFPIGRTIELYGPESSGKTTVALLHAAEMQKAKPDKYVLFIDVEHALDLSLVKRYGINDNRFLHSQPDTAEQALDIAEAFIRGGETSLIIVDSVSALLPEAEEKEDMAKASVGLQSRLMSKALRKLTPPSTKFECTIIFINQIREKVGVMYGNPETTSGGRALAFYASVRINVRKGEAIPDPAKKDEQMGHYVNAKVVKNKTARPYRQASFPLIYGVGVDKTSEVVDIAILANVVDKGGAWLRIKGTDDKPIVRKIWSVQGLKEDGSENIVATETTINFQGKDKFTEYLRTDPGLYELLSRAAVYGESITIEQFKGGFV